MNSASKADAAPLDTSSLYIQQPSAQPIEDALELTRYEHMRRLWTENRNEKARRIALESENATLYAVIDSLMTHQIELVVRDILRQITDFPAMEKHVRAQLGRQEKLSLDSLVQELENLIEAETCPMQDSIIMGHGAPEGEGWVWLEHDLSKLTAGATSLRKIQQLTTLLEGRKDIDSKLIKQVAIITGQGTAALTKPVDPEGNSLLKVVASSTLSLTGQAAILLFPQLFTPLLGGHLAAWLLNRYAGNVGWKLLTVAGRVALNTLS